MPRRVRGLAGEQCLGGRFLHGLERPGLRFRQIAGNGKPCLIAIEYDAGRADAVVESRGPVWHRPRAAFFMSRRVSVLLARHTFKLKRLLQEKPIEAPVVAIKTTHGLIITLERHKKGEREMGSQARSDDLESVIPFSPAARSMAPDGIDQVDKAGQTILGLLHKAASVAEANSQHALDMAQKLSHQLRAAEDRNRRTRG